MFSKLKIALFTNHDKWSILSLFPPTANALGEARNSSNIRGFGHISFIIFFQKEVSLYTSLRIHAFPLNSYCAFLFIKEYKTGCFKKNTSPFRNQLIWERFKRDHDIKYIPAIQFTEGIGLYSMFCTENDGNW